MKDLSESEGEADQDLKNCVKNPNSTHTPPHVSSIPLTECPLSDAIFKELSVINGQINGLKRKELVTKLKKYNLNHKGHISVLRKRLKNHFKIKKLTKAKLMEIQNLQPYYVVIDFEATCQENNPVDFKYEIIEFPAILIHTETLKIVDVFHSYVKPVIHPKLTAFCTSLTGITQDQVDKAPIFTQVLSLFENWLKSHGLLFCQKFIVTDGPWDMGRFLFLQCKISGLKYPAYAKEWTNVRRIFRNFYKYHQGGTLEDMIRFVGLTFEGDPHRGLDDAYNIARMFLHLLRDGALVRTNERITQHTRSHNNMHFVRVTYVKPLNTHEEVTSLRAEMANLNISDTETSDDESPVFGNLKAIIKTEGSTDSSRSLAYDAQEVTKSEHGGNEIPASDSGKMIPVENNSNESQSKNEQCQSFENNSSEFKTSKGKKENESFYGSETHDRIMTILHGKDRKDKSKKFRDKTNTPQDTKSDTIKENPCAIVHDESL